LTRSLQLAAHGAGLCAKAQRLGGALAGLLLLACAGVPREVHEPRPYPETKLTASSMALEVVDSRPAPPSATTRQLLLPNDFEALGQQRLNGMLAGQGPSLQVIAYVNDSTATDLEDARGEMTRVLVKLEFEVKVQDGPQLRRARSESSSDLPRDEATPEELALLLRTTSLDAFDRYWADPKTTAALNADVAAYSQRAAK
jgi:hypothetical protein